MTKLTRVLALTSMLAVAAGAMTVAPAQDKGAKKTARKGGTVKVKQSEKTDKYYISVYDADDKYVGGGRASGYDTKEDVTKGIDAIRNALDGAKTEYIKGGGDKDQPEEKKKEPKKKETKKGG